MTKHPVSFFLVSTFCFAISLNSCGNSCGPFGNSHTKVFIDSMKLPMRYDPLYLNVHAELSFGDSSTFDVQFSNDLIDSFIVRINVHGSNLFVDSFYRSPSMEWNNDTLNANFDYYTTSVVQQNNPNKVAMKDNIEKPLCTPTRQLFIITHTTLVIPVGKTVDSLGILRWRIK